MSDLDQISAMLGALQADMRSAKEWFDKHEAADQHRFEELARKIDAHAITQGSRVSALELHDAAFAGGWKMLTVVSGVVAFIVSAASRWLFH